MFYDGPLPNRPLRVYEAEDLPHLIGQLRGMGLHVDTDNAHALYLRIGRENWEGRKDGEVWMHAGRIITLAKTEATKYLREG